MCPDGLSAVSGLLCSAVEATSAFVGSLVGFAAGGGGGALFALVTAGVTSPAIPATSWAGAVNGGAAGLAVGQLVTNTLFSQDGGRGSSGNTLRGGSQSDRDPDYVRLLRERNPSRRQRTRIHEEIRKRKQGRSNLDSDELQEVFDQIMGPRK